MRSFLKAALLMAVALASGAAVAAPSPALPAADPPAVLGEAYAIDGLTMTPADAPFDDVGLAALDTGIGASAEVGPGSNITMAHRTLPLPSYAEVTALDSGRTILVRIERRGPLAGPAFVALSAGALAQIGADPAQPLGVRVRRVAPQEYERSLLRTGQRAPERLATPKSLLEVLRRRLAEKATVAAPTAPVIETVELPASSPPPTTATVANEPAPLKAAAANPPPPATKPPAIKPPVAKPTGAFRVQVAAFASRAGAEATARKLGGNVSAAGKLWRVRLGPFATRAEASAALTTARKAGFVDARVFPGQVVSGK